MYVPKHFTADDAVVAELLTNLEAADLVTATPEGPYATFLPLLFEPATGEHGALLGHVARKNRHWTLESLGEAMVIARGPDAYVTPSWYAAKAEHGKVVPTWNYLTAHVYGELRIHDDVAFLEDVVRRLTDRHEAAEATPWSVDDAPRPYVDGQLRAIVGVELRITRVEAKAKFGQNRSAADLDGVVEGLTARGDVASAEATTKARRR
jgi:transcriptional regulator